MAIFFLDPVAGNDANDGLSFANRKRTFNSASTAAVAGDAIHVIASPDPVSVGSATWTDNSKDIAWTNTSNLRLDGCNSGWVGVTNVTVTHPTDNLEKTGSSYLHCNIATAFTTGKIAYKTLPAPLVVSAFQQIALYFRTSSISSTTMNFKVALCSDTTGDTIVAEVNKTLTANVDILSTAYWLGMMLDYGSSFPSTPINSIAIYLNADPSASGFRQFMFDGLTCCKAPGAADLIDLYTLIGKNTEGEPEWYPVTDLSEAGVQLAGCRQTVSQGTGFQTRPYRGVTEAVTTYIRNQLVLSNPWTTTDAEIRRDFVDVIGGWNRTDMSTQTGETWICGAQLFTGINYSSNTYTDGNILNIGLSHCLTGISLSVGQGEGSVVKEYDLLGVLACDTPVVFTPTGITNRPAGYYKFSCRQIWSSAVGQKTPGRPGEFTVGRIHGFTDPSNEVAWTPGFFTEYNPSLYTIGKIDNNTRAIKLDNYAGDINLKLTGTVIENNNTDFVLTTNTPERPFNLHFDNMADLLIDSNLDGLPFLSSLDDYPTVVKQTRIGGDPLKNRTVLHGQLFFEMSQAIRHTASGFSWRLYLANWVNFKNDRKEGAPGFPMQYVMVEADKEVTVTCWLYVEFDLFFYDSTPWPTPMGTAGLMVQGDVALGISRLQTLADMTIIGSWQQLTLTFTPNAAGVIRVDAFAFGNLDQTYVVPPSTFSTYYDDLVVTQAP